MQENFCLDYSECLREWPLLFASTMLDEPGKGGPGQRIAEIAKSFEMYLRTGGFSEKISMELSLVLTVSSAKVKSLLEKKWDKAAPLSARTLALCCAEHFCSFARKSEGSLTTVKRGEEEYIQVTPFFWRDVTSFACSASMKFDHVEGLQHVFYDCETLEFMKKTEKEGKGEEYACILGKEVYVDLYLKYFSREKRETLHNLLTKYFVSGDHRLMGGDTRLSMLAAIWVQKVADALDDNPTSLPNPVSIEAIASHCIKKFFDEYRQVEEQMITEILLSRPAIHMVNSLKKKWIEVVSSGGGYEKHEFANINWKKVAGIQFAENPSFEFNRIFAGVNSDDRERISDLLDKNYTMCRNLVFSPLEMIKQSAVDEIMLSRAIILAKRELKKRKNQTEEDAADSKRHRI